MGTTRQRNRRAVAAVELAVLLPFLAFIFVVTVDFCRVFYATQTVHNCARAGAYYQANISGNTTWEAGSTDYTTMKTAAIADADTLSPPMTTANVADPVSGTDADGNATVAVTVNYTFSMIMGFPGVPATLPISRTVVMRLAPNSPDPP